MTQHPEVASTGQVLGDGKLEGTIKTQKLDSRGHCGSSTGLERDSLWLGNQTIQPISGVLLDCESTVVSKWTCVLVAQSCLTLCDPMACSLPDFSVCGILQARILKWVAIPFSRGSSRPKD